jgi:hypothetical protein
MGKFLLSGHCDRSLLLSLHRLVDAKLLDHICRPAGIAHGGVV